MNTTGMPPSSRIYPVLLLMMMTGCGDTLPKKAGPTSPGSDDVAGDVAEMLKEYCAAHKRPPRNFADLADATASHPLGYAAVESQQFVVFYNVMVDPASASPEASQTIVAHHADAATTGGWVVLQNGTIRQVTPDEFSTLKKAGKGR